MLPAIAKAKDLEILAANLRDAKPFGIERLYTQLGSCHGPAGGAPGRRRVSTERIPRDKSPNLARRGEALSPIAAEACSPAVFTCTSVQREPTPGGPGSGLRQGRKRFLCQLPLWFYIYNQDTGTQTITFL
jgi:hypothetical protein